MPLGRHLVWTLAPLSLFHTRLSCKPISPMLAPLSRSLKFSASRFAYTPPIISGDSPLIVPNFPGDSPSPPTFSIPRRWEFLTRITPHHFLLVCSIPKAVAVFFLLARPSDSTRQTSRYFDSNGCRPSRAFFRLLFLPHLLFSIGWRRGSSSCRPSSSLYRQLPRYCARVPTIMDGASFNNGRISNWKVSRVRVSTKSVERSTSLSEIFLS